MGDVLSQLPNGIENVEASPVSPIFNSLPVYHFIAGWDSAMRSLWFRSKRNSVWFLESFSTATCTCRLPFSTCSKYTFSNSPRSCFVYAYMSATWFYAPMASAEVQGEVVFYRASQTMLMFFFLNIYIYIHTICHTHTHIYIYRLLGDIRNTASTDIIISLPCPSMMLNYLCWMPSQCDWWP